MIRKSIFHEEWWLDDLAPGRWREVACFRGGRTAGYLRFVERRESGVTICEMPPITRFLGPIVTNASSRTEARVRSAYSIIVELLKQIAEYDHVEMTLGTECSDLAPFLTSGYEVKVHPTFLLDCNRHLEELWAGLRDKTKNVIRRARECLIVRDIDDVNQFMENLEATGAFTGLLARQERVDEQGQLQAILETGYAPRRPQGSPR